MDAVFPDPDIAYRVNRRPGSGNRSYPPAGAAREENGKTTVYASWNGATQVASWRVWSGPAGREGIEKTVPRVGFETTIPVSNGESRFYVEALDRTGRSIGRSQPFSVEAAQG